MGSPARLGFRVVASIQFPGTFHSSGRITKAVNCEWGPGSTFLRCHPLPSQFKSLECLLEAEPCAIEDMAGERMVSCAGEEKGYSVLLCKDLQWSRKC